MQGVICKRVQDQPMVARGGVNVTMESECDHYQKGSSKNHIDRVKSEGEGEAGSLN